MGLGSLLWSCPRERLMPAERVSMRRVREMLRYRAEQGPGYKAISLRVGAVPSTVRETLKRVEAAVTKPAIGTPALLLSGAE